MLTDNKDLKRYEYAMDGYVVFANYRLEGDVLSILYVEAPPALRGKGAAGAVMQGIVDEARQNGWKLRPVCGYAAAWLRKHKDYADLIA